MKKIIILILIIMVAYFGYQYYQQRNIVSISQDISKRGYRLSLKYDDSIWNASHSDFREAPGYYDYGAGITLRNNDDKNISISFSYEFSNNRDDTPIEVGDTGGGLWPPQKNDLIRPFDPDRYIYLGKYLGKELYTNKKIDATNVVYQRLQDGTLTGNMPLLSKDQERVNYFDKFAITARFGLNEKDYEELNKEFLKILKTMKIEKIPQEKTTF